MQTLNYTTPRQQCAFYAEAAPANLVQRFVFTHGGQVASEHNDNDTTTVVIQTTPGGAGTYAVVHLSSVSSKALKAMWNKPAFEMPYDSDPHQMERHASIAVGEYAPELSAAIVMAMSFQPDVLQIKGLPAPDILPRTPLNGELVEKDIRPFVLQLIGCLTANQGLGGFAYRSENNARLLRGVSPVAMHAGQASSQGTADLGWHNDNANRAMCGLNENFGRQKGFMNPIQAFVAIRPDASTPMEVLALPDVLKELRVKHGACFASILEAPLFAVDKPDSHGGGRDVENVALLVRDDLGYLHSRFHAKNIVGMNNEAANALAVFKEVVAESTSVLRVQSAPGDLLMYSNDQTMHRRSKYNARYDGKDRYYVRLYLAPLAAFQTVDTQVNGRVID